MQLGLTLSLNSIIFRGNSNMYGASFEEKSLNLLSVISLQANAVPCKSVTKRGRLLTRTVLGAVDTPRIKWAGLIAHLSSPPCSTVTRPQFRITWFTVLALTSLRTVVTKIPRTADLFAACPMITSPAMAITRGYITAAMLRATTFIRAIETIVTWFASMLAGIAIVAK